MISVCIATYNGEKFIKEQLVSILSQLEKDDEVIISDDNSNDCTLSIIYELNDPRIKIHINQTRKGVVGNFENALNKSIGDYIFLCDQDDIWLENKVEVCMNALMNADLIMHNVQVIDAYGNILYPSFFKLRGTQKGYFRNFIKNTFIGCCLAFRRSILNYVLPIPNVVIHDMWIGLLASRKGHVELIDQPLMLYRRHCSNASPTSEKSTLTLRKKITYRIKILFYTIFK